MGDFKFENPFAPPVDPAYTRFESGWEKWVNDGGAFKNPTLRWHPRKGEWFVYPPPRWEHLDRGIPDLDPPALVSGFTLPQLFKTVAETASKYPQWPQLVWNPHTGSWREARDTGQQPAKPPVPPDSSSRPSADSAVAKARADRKRELDAAFADYAAGSIPIGELNERLADIERRYEGLLGSSHK